MSTKLLYFPSTVIKQNTFWNRCQRKSYLHTILELLLKLASSTIKSVPPMMDPEYGNISTQYSVQSGQQFFRDVHVGWQEHESNFPPQFPSHVCPVKKIKIKTNSSLVTFKSNSCGLTELNQCLIMHENKMKIFNFPNNNQISLFCILKYEYMITF